MPRSGTGRVYQRGGVWWIQYGHRGTTYRESSKSTKKGAATALLKKRLGEIGSGKFVGPDAERVTLDDLAEGLEQHYKLKGLRTWDRAALSVSHLRAYFGGDARAIDITTKSMAAYALHRREEEGAAPATVKRELMALSKMFSLALVENGGPLSTKPGVPEMRVNNVRTGFLDGAELDAVIAELPEPLRPVIQFARYTGWRRGEVLALTWARVDFDAGVVRLDTSKNDEPRSFPFTMLPPLAELLEQLRDRTRAIEKRTGRIVPWVFHRDGRPIKSMRRAWKGACKRAGVPGHIVHDLRRTAVRNLVRAGVPERVAMELVGHKTRSIFDRYNIVNDADQREAVEKLARHLAGRADERRTILPLRASGEG